MCLTDWPVGAAAGGYSTHDNTMISPLLSPLGTIEKMSQTTGETCFRAVRSVVHVARHRRN